jgi:hypothetical protein
MTKANRQFNLHLVSDATGTTLLGLARACLAQFEGIEPNQKFWPLVRTQRQLDAVIAKIEELPGPVIFTFVDNKMRERLQERCNHLGIPCVPVLEPVIKALSTYLGVHAKSIPGAQHTLDEDYFKRVAALDFAMHFDDGRTLEGLKEADVILVGVSRTSKTPTCLFLARRGVKAANIPLVPGVTVPPEHFRLEKPLYVGLKVTPERLYQMRRSRLKADSDAKAVLDENAYLDLEKIEEEMREAKRLFSKHGWPVIDVTKRSIEETSAEIMSILQNRHEKNKETPDVHFS